MQESSILIEMCEALVRISGRYGVRPRTLVDIILDVADESKTPTLRLGTELNYHTTEVEPVTLHRQRGRPPSTPKGEEIMIDDPRFVDVAISIGFPREIAAQLKTRGWSQKSIDRKTKKEIVRHYMVKHINVGGKPGRPVYSVETANSHTPGQSQGVPVSTIMKGLDPEPATREAVKPPRQRVSKPK